MRLTGETPGVRADPPALPPQPGGRPAAPGDVGLLQAFLNTHFDLVTEHGADLLATRAGARRWLSAGGLTAADARITQADLDRLRRVREGLRELIEAG
ncbi:MAG: ABATE domain-containing protein, partial [Solirubrobacterales bacterium]|nr:ABATE domain-containing protein [Solirubrobacterales bacterium]